MKVPFSHLQPPAVHLLCWNVLPPTPRAEVDKHRAFLRLPDYGRNFRAYIGTVVSCSILLNGSGAGTSAKLMLSIAFSYELEKSLASSNTTWRCDYCCQRFLGITANPFMVLSLSFYKYYIKFFLKNQLSDFLVLPLGFEPRL